MATKQPKWDKQEGAPIIMADPKGPNKSPSLTEPLRAGQQAVGTISGVEIVVLLTEVVSPTTGKGRIVGIMDGFTDRDTLGDLSTGDIVLIDRDDMYSLDIDVAELP